MNQFQLILLILSVCESRRIIWQQRTNFGDATNWEGDTVPCGSDALLFPPQSNNLIKLSNFTMKEIILPKSGGFILDTKAALTFRESDSKCKPNATRTYKNVIQTPWLMSSNWIGTVDPNGRSDQTTSVINAATPHDERIPCDNDEIIFPINNSFVVDLQSLPFLTFKSIAIDGRVMSLHEFKDFLFSSYGQSLFKNTDNTLLGSENSCNDGSTCACHQKEESLRQILCENEKPLCEAIPHCSNPIKPIGHCCFECGAIFHMQIDSIKNFNLDDFRRQIERGKMHRIILT